MEDHSKLQKAFNSLKPSKSPTLSWEDSQEKPDTGNQSLHSKRSFAQLGRSIHLGRIRSTRRNVTESLRLPPCSRPHSPHRIASVQNSISPSYGQTDAYKIIPLNRQILNSDDGFKHESLGDEDSTEDEPDPTLLGSLDYHNFLGGASGRKAQVDLSPASPALPVEATPKQSGGGIKLDADKYRTPRTAIKPTTVLWGVWEAPAETPTRQPKLKAKQSLPLLERRSEHLKEQYHDSGLSSPPLQHHPSLQTLRSQDSPSNWHSTSKTTPNKEGSTLKESFTTPNTTRAASGPVAPILTGASPFFTSRSTSQPRLPRTPQPIPTSIPTLIPTPSITVDRRPLSGRSMLKPQMPQTLRPLIDPITGMAPSSRFREDSPTLGVKYPKPDQVPRKSSSEPSKPVPAGYISYKEIDPEKLRPFIGPLLPQQPPPTKPPPPPPTIRKGRSNMHDSIETPPQTIIEPTLPSRPNGTSDTMTTPVKHSAPSVKTNASTASRAEDDLLVNASQKSGKGLRTTLRQKVSTLFGDEVATPSVCRTAEADPALTSISTYRPISMNLLDPDSHSFSDIFDDVFNAARDSASDSQRSAGPSFASGRPSLSALSGEVAVETAPRARIPSRVTTQTAPRDEVAGRLAARLGVTDPASRAAILAALTEVAQGAPLLTGHPVIRGDLPLQARLGMIEDPTDSAGLRENRGKAVHAGSSAAPALTRAVAPAATAGLHVPPLNVGRQRPTQVAMSTRPASRSMAPAVEPFTGYTTRTLVTVPDGMKSQGDIDPTPTFDRSVDLTWYRYAKKSKNGIRESSFPTMAEMFDAHSTVFMAKYSRGRESRSTRYDHLQRFAYFDLAGPIRFKIMEKLLDEYLPGKPILLNHARQASPAWPDDAFATLWQVLGPLQNVLMACPRLRADVMTAICMTQPFHVIFSPFVNPITQPLPTKWFFKYVYFMQDVRIELDMTKLGFGQAWQATGLSTRLWDIGDLVHTFVEAMLRRDPQAHPMAQLTIHCRRFFGYRQGKNPHQGDVVFYKSPAGVNEKQKPSTQPEGQPWNYGRKPASFPPSVNNPCSGHRRHHTGGSERVPFVHEGHMSVADPFHKLTGRVWSVRMVGMSEKWTMKLYKFWPKVEFDAIPKENLGLHIDRYTPSRHSYAAPGHAIFLDYGIRAGLHRFPPLPDSEPMVCAVYDGDNDVFLEVGSGNILTVNEHGVEIIARSENPPIPRRDLPYRGGSPVSLDGLAVAPSRIPGPIGRPVSPTMQAMRKSTPKKALQLLGLRGDGDTTVTPRASHPLQDDDDEYSTPTTSRVSSAALHAPRRHASTEIDTDDERLSELASEPRRSSSTLSFEPKTLSSKKSYLGLMGGDRPKPTK